MTDIDAKSLHALIRVLERYQWNNAAKVTVGYFVQDGRRHGIRLQKMNLNTEHGNDVYCISLSIEIPTSSGMFYVPIGEFSSVHPDAWKDYTPVVRIDQNWISWTTAVGHNRNACSVNASPRSTAVGRNTFTINGVGVDELVGELEGQLFQYNLVCDGTDMFDEKYITECFKFVAEEFESMYNGAQITSVDVMPMKIRVSTEGVEFKIPYDKIVREIEKYVYEGYRP